ncbi:MAG: hypothetical protein Q9207_003709 [Kuettlingeria erythrocarpa]
MTQSMDEKETSRPSQPHNGNFPFMQLPFELRAMVYREVFVPAMDTPIRDWVVPARDVRIYRNRVRTEKKHLAIVLTNKQISGEASDVLYEDCPVNLQVTSFGHYAHGAVPENAGVEHPFRRLRNVEIELDNWLSALPQSPWATDDANRGVAIFCDELVFQGAEKGVDTITLTKFEGVLQCVDWMMSDLHGPGWESVTLTAATAPPKLPDPFKWDIPRSTRSLIFSGWGDEIEKFDDVIDVIQNAQQRLAQEIKFQGYDDAVAKIRSWTFETAHLVAFE